MYCSTISAHHHNITGALNLLLSQEVSLPGRELYGGIQQAVHALRTVPDRLYQGSIKLHL
jgi:hypothetical protein